MTSKSSLVPALVLSLVVAACQTTTPSPSSSAAVPTASAVPTESAFALTPQPKLVLNIVVDGLSMETPLRYYDQLSDGGFKRFITDGAMFSNAHHHSGGTWTGQGHPTILTGSYGHTNGMVSDGWVDRSTGQLVEPFADPAYTLLGMEGAKGYSPQQLLVSNVSDELARATNHRSKVISIAANDKAAVAHGGRLGTAYWLQGASPPFDAGSPNFVTSTYYLDEYPDWWTAFHAGKPADKYFGEWAPLLEDEAYALAAPDTEPYFHDWLGFGTQFPLRVTGGLDAPGSAYYVALAWSPFAHDYTVEFAQAAIQGENLGKNETGAPDFLSIGLPSYDFIKHIFGAEPKQAVDAFLRTDRALEKLLDFVDTWVGLDNVLVSITADHGPGTSPDHAAKYLGFTDAKRIDVAAMAAGLQDHLASRFGPGEYILNQIVPFIYLDYDVIDEKGLDRAAVENAAADFLVGFPGVESVYTRTQLTTGALPPRELAEQVANGWHRERSGDLVIIQKPFWYYWDHPEIPGLTAMHGSPWSYDTHVPLMFLGSKWVVPGEYKDAVRIVDIAPTLANILRVNEPSGSEGQVLSQALR